MPPQGKADLSNLSPSSLLFHVSLTSITPLRTSVTHHYHLSVPAAAKKKRKPPGKTKAKAPPKYHDHPSSDSSDSSSCYSHTDASSSEEDEGDDGYKRGGYHPVNVSVTSRGEKKDTIG